MQQLPDHLKKYIVSQDDHQYTSLEHSTWRFILQKLTQFLSVHAHESYLDGLKKTGITLNQIPQIRKISEHLEAFGWRALPVSGFIPPAAFMELQSLGVLPIATEMRSFDHLMYTPAPDIVHEAAGHAPLLANPEYSDYLKAYAQVSRRAIISSEDLAVYKAIRVLSDIKENSKATSEQIQNANEQLNLAQNSISHLSEAALLARMNWWTAEYGLIGSLSNPKIFGAGLLSSIGESELCLSDKVKKIPLTLDCINYSYDITEPQPQLFVTPDFKHLHSVLNEFSETMAFRVGGRLALEKAFKSQAINSFELDSGLQIGGTLAEYRYDNQDQLCFIKFKGPSQLAFNEHELSGHGTKYHAHGFSSPMGRLKGFKKPLHLWSSDEWNLNGFKINSQALFDFESGIQVTGTLKKILSKNGQSLLVTLENAKCTFGDELLFHPDWGTFDMALGTQVTSVWGGPPDRTLFGEKDDFESVKIPKKQLSSFENQQLKFYNEIQKAYETGSNKHIEIESFKKSYHDFNPKDSLFDWEIEQIKKLN